MKGNSLGYLTKEGFRSVWVNRLMSLASITVLLACLVIIGTGAMLFFNINNLLDVVESQNVVMVYIKDEASEIETSTVGLNIKAIDNVEECEYISKEDAYREQLASMGEDAALLEGLDNPLPNAYKVTVKDLNLFDQTVAEINKLDFIESIRENSDLSEKLIAIRRAVTYIGASLVALLFIVSVFIIANTVRITMYNRRLEISIMKAVGATNGFIRWPFVVEGVTLGIISGLISFALVFAVYQAIVYFFRDVISIIGTKPVEFFDYGWYILIIFIGVGIFTGGFGSAVSMGRYLKEQGSVVTND
ncbi:MAG: permease-like cell division protein FtsX [Clostridiales bacterium]|nr:permease-like cell division protein FtsX [Clostridia bacterium]MCR4564419.1 permease-like cell division protein FtsX [Clostridiales bacterium]